MVESVPEVLKAWSNFYVLAGSAAAGLIGLMFVVITLVRGEERVSNNPDGISTFSTPTVLHFSAALLVSALLSAPWGSLIPVAVLVGLAGLVGIANIVRVGYLARRLSSYTPDAEDWTWYTMLPLVAYGALLGGGIALPGVPVHALFALAGGVLLLIFIGIHNAWDVVTFLAIGAPGAPPKP